MTNHQPSQPGNELSSEELESRCAECERLLHLREQELNLLKLLSEKILAETEVRKILDIVATYATELVQGENCIIPVLDASREFYTYVAGCGEQAQTMIGVQFDADIGMCGWVLTHEIPILFGESRNWWQDETITWEVGDETMILVPLMGKNKIIGGITVMGKRSDTSFTERDMDLLILFANHASIAIEKAQLFEELKCSTISLEQELDCHKKTETAALQIQSELKQEIANLQARLQEQAIQIKIANREFNDCLETANQDLRAPINSIRTSAEELLSEDKEKISAQSINRLNDIITAISNVGTALDELLDRSRNS